MLVVVLDRVLHRDDVPIVVLIDEVNHAGQAGRLAGASGSGHQQKAAGPNDEAADGVGHAQLLKGQELVRNAPQDNADVAPLLEDGNPEARTVRELDGKVGPAFLLKLLLAAVRGDALHESSGVVAVEGLRIEAFHAAIMPEDRRLPHRDVQVAGLELDHGRKEFLNQYVGSGHGDSRLSSDVRSTNVMTTPQSELLLR